MLQSALAIVGAAKQTAKGSLAADPTFVFGLTDGAPLQVEVDQNAEERTLDASLISPDVNREGVIPGQEWTSRAFPKSIALELYAALGGISTAGPNPYIHTITPATDVPYLTRWGKFGGQLYRVQDAKTDELTLSWDGTGPLELEASCIGTVLGFPSSITPIVNEEQASYYRAAGGAFKMHARTNVPVTAPIKAGNVKISNGLEPILLSASVVPDDVAPGHKEITVGVTLVVNDLTEWRRLVTDDDAGTSPSQVAVFGSIEHQFNIDANTYVKVTAPRVAFTGDIPDADPAGGAAELELEGTVVLPAAGAAFTAEVKNAHASY